MEAIIPILGFLVGVLVGLFGMGGGSILTPLQIIVLGSTPVVSVATGLVHTTMIRLIGAFQFYKNKAVDVSLMKYFAYGALPASLMGATLISYLRSNTSQIDMFVKFLLAFMLTVAGFFLLTYATTKSNKGHNYTPKAKALNAKKKTLACLIGFVAGLAIGITSVGSGVIMMPFLILVFRLSPQKLVGSNMLFAVPLNAFPALVYLYAGNVNLPLLGLLLVGSIPGTLLGCKLNSRAPTKFLPFLVSSLLIILGLLTILESLINV
jgi:hypothetical protein